MILINHSDEFGHNNIKNKKPLFKIQLCFCSSAGDQNPTKLLLRLLGSSQINQDSFKFPAQGLMHPMMF